MTASCLLLAACGGPERPATDPADVVATGSTTDWIALDRALVRPVLGRYARWFCDAPTEQLLARRAALASTATHDSLGLNELTTRPLEDQRRRRREAARLLGEAMLLVQDRAERLRADRIDRFVFKDLHATLDQVLQRLHTAVGTDPEDADAWAGLAYFSAVIGDQATASRARRAYLERAVTADTRGRTRTARVVLDEAWALREAGDHQQCQQYLDAHRGLLDAAPPAAEALPPRLERDLIAALLAAEGGDRLGTRRRINRLPLVPVQHGTRTRDSTYLRTWVRAWLELSSGNLDAAAQAISRQRPDGRHTAVDWRFWQDVGHIAEACGQREMARAAWGHALHLRPYLGFFPRTILQGPDHVAGYPDTDAPYGISYRTFFLGGSAWGFAMTRALLCQDTSPADNPHLWRQAMDALDRCIRRGDHAGEARLLRARLHLRRGNLIAATTDLRDPTVSHLAAGSLAQEVALLRGMVAVDGPPASLQPVVRERGHVQPLELASLFAAADDSLLTILGDSPAERTMWIEMLGQRYRQEPAAATRAPLAEAHHLDGDHDAVQHLLAPAWPDRLSPRERVLLMLADRARGNPDRAREVAASPAAWLEPGLVVAAVVTLLDAGEPGAAATLMATARQRWPEHGGLAELAGRLP